MGLTLTEIKTIEEFQNKNYSYLRGGHPDFVFYKEYNGKLIDIKFVEVKNG